MTARRRTLALAALAALCMAPPAPRKRVTIEQPPPLEFAAASLHDLPVALVVDDLLRDWTKIFRTYRMGDLAETSERLAGGVFAPVTVVASPLDRRAEAATLWPRVIDTGQAAPIADSQPRQGAIVIEWSFLDATGCVVWIDTFVGRGEGGWEGSQIKPLRLALEDSLRAAHAALAGSPEIAAYARRWHEEEARGPFVGPPAPDSCLMGLAAVRREGSQ